MVVGGIWKEQTKFPDGMVERRRLTAHGVELCRRQNKRATVRCRRGRGAINGLSEARGRGIYTCKVGKNELFNSCPFFLEHVARGVDLAGERAVRARRKRLRKAEGSKLEKRLRSVRIDSMRGGGERFDQR